MSYQRYGAEYTPTSTGGTLFTKGLTAALSFVGANRPRGQKKTAAALSFVGSPKKRTNTKRTGGLSFSGSIGRIKVAVKSFAASLSFSGSNKRRAGKKLAGSLSFAGAIKKIARKKVAPGNARLIFSGNTLNEGTILLDEPFTYTAAANLTAQTGWTTFGSTDFSPKISAAQGIEGNASGPASAKLLNNGYAFGDYSFKVVAVDTTDFPIWYFHYSVADYNTSGNGTVFYFNSTSMAVSNVIAGVGNDIITSGTPPVAGDVITVRIRQTLTQLYKNGTLIGTWYGTPPSLGGYIGVSLNKVGTKFDDLKLRRVEPSLTIAKITGRAFAAALSFSGSVKRRTGHKMAATLSSSGALKRRAGKKLAATLSSSGALKRIAGKKLAATLTPTATIKRKTSKAIAGFLNFSGPITLTENFTYANGTLGSTAAWDIGVWDAGDLSIVSNAVANTVNGTWQGSITTDASFTFGTYSIKIAIVPATGDFELGVLTSGSAAVVTQYALGIKATGQFYVVKYVGGTATFVISNTTTTVTAGDIFSLRVFASGRLEVYRNGNIIGYTTTTPISNTSGPITLESNDSTGRYDDLIYRPANPSLVKRTAHKLAGGLSFVGSLKRRAGKKLAGSLSFVGSLIYSGSRSIRFAASLPFSGAIKRRTNHKIAATLSFAGNVTKRLARKVAAASISFSGALARGGRFKRNFNSNLPFSGSIKKRAGKKLAGSIGPAGALRKIASHKLSGALSFVGSVKKRGTRRLAGTLNFTTAFKARVGKRFAATLGTTGALKRRTGKKLAGTLSFVGAIHKRGTRRLAGALSFSGTIARIPVLARFFTASLSFSGSVKRRTGHKLAGALSFVGSVKRKTAKRFAAALTMTGFLLNGSQKIRQFAASLSFAGSFKKSTRHRLAAALGPSGSLGKRTARRLTAVLSISGNLHKRAGRRFSAGLSPAGVLRARVSKVFHAALAFSGKYSIMTRKALSASVNFVGQLRRFVTHRFTASLPFSGAIHKVAGKHLSATLLPQGTVKKLTSHKLVASLLSVGFLRHNGRFVRSFNASLHFVGALRQNRIFFKNFDASLSFAGNLVTTVFGEILSLVARVVALPKPTAIVLMDKRGTTVLVVPEVITNRENVVETDEFTATVRTMNEFDVEIE